MDNFKKCRALDVTDRPRIIAHYHLYKAGGSTVIKGLIRQFGGGFAELDKHQQFKRETAYNIEFFERSARTHPHLVAMSAHRVVSNIHMSKTLDVFPIAFIRHPLLRAASVWRFERKRTDDWPPKREALVRDLPAWIDWCLSRDQFNECSNYQSQMLSLQDNGTIPSRREGSFIRGDLPTAIDRLDSMSVVGVVEEYARSVAAINAAAQAVFPGFSLADVPINATKNVTDWQAELTDLEASLPPIILERFNEANDDDLALWTRYKVALDRHSTAPNTGATMAA